MPNIAAEPLVVAVGVLINNRQVLVAQRKAGVHLAELWEFPGGKAEAGEAVELALTRELREELDIELTAFEPLMELPFDYPGKSVLLKVFRIQGYLGQPRGREGQQVAWCGLDQLEKLAFPPANQPILDYVRRALAA